MKKYSFLICIFPFIAFILEMLPYGAVLNFATEGDGVIRRTFSYFDMTVFGYANFGPILTAVFSVGALALCVIACIKHKRSLYKVCVMLLAIAFVLSLCPFMLGIRYFSVVGLLISISLAVSSAVAFWYYKILKNAKEAH